MVTNIKTTLISDLGCATAIVCEGLLPVELVKDSNSPKIHFVFEDNSLVQKTMEGYWLGKHKSVSRDYFENMKMLKNRIYTFKEDA